MSRLPIENIYKSHNALKSIDAIFVTDQRDYNWLRLIPKLLYQRIRIYFLFWRGHSQQSVKDQFKSREFDNIGCGRTVTTSNFIRLAIMWCMMMQSVDEKVKKCNELLIELYNEIMTFYHQVLHYIEFI